MTLPKHSSTKMVRHRTPNAAPQCDVHRRIDQPDEVADGTLAAGRFVPAAVGRPDELAARVVGITLRLVGSIRLSSRCFGPPLGRGSFDFACAPGGPY